METLRLSLREIQHGKFHFLQSADKIGYMELIKLTAEYDQALAELIRHNLKAHGLDIPGTVYFDNGLDHLSKFYSDTADRRAYYVLTDNDDVLIGGVGFAEFAFFDNCAELQKIYLADHVKGRGLGRMLVKFIEEKAAEQGFAKMYLETHTNLDIAIRMYEKLGYREISRPASVQHGAMNKFYIKDI